MLQEIILTVEGAMTGRADERSLTRVCSHVFPQVSPLNEPLPTFITHSIFRPGVRLHVDCESGLGSEMFVTFLAVERFLARMNSRMYFQFVFTGQGLFTNVTFITIATVAMFLLFMFLQISLSGKKFQTHTTLELDIAVVIYLVLREGIIVLIPLKTNITFIVLRFFMRLLMLCKIM